MTTIGQHTISERLRPLRFTPALIMVCLAMFSPTTVHAQEQDDPRNGQPGPPESVESRVDGLVQELGDASFEKRDAAARELCKIGMPAAARLKAATKDSNFEVAQRARKILASLEALLFAGVDVQVQVTPPKAAWNQPVELRLRMTNTSKHTARLPFDRAAIDAANRGGLDDIDSIGLVLDVAEWIAVTASDGKRVELHIDDLGVDPGITRMLDTKIEKPPETLLDAGASAEIRLPGINRGLARYPLLSRGEYAFRFAYRPDWENEDLNIAQVGYISSPAANVNIVEAAPPGITAQPGSARLEATVAGGEVIVRIVNRQDVPVLVNTNLGATLPFAQLSCECDSLSGVMLIPVMRERDVGWEDFSRDGFVSLGSGESIELHRASVPTLLERLSERGADLDDGRIVVRFSYRSFCDRGWQHTNAEAIQASEQLTQVFSAPLPRRILAAYVRSGDLVLEQQRR